MSNKQYSDIPWWAIVLGFVLCWPIGMILLFMNLSGMKLPTGTAGTTEEKKSAYSTPPPRAKTNTAQNQQTAQARAASTPPTAQAAAQAKGAWTPFQNAPGQTTPNETAQKKQRKSSEQRPYRRFKKPKSGKTMTTIGAVMSFTFAIAMADELVNAVQHGFWSTLDEWFPVLGFLCAGLFLLGKGISTTRWSRRCKFYLNIIGQRNSYFLSDLAATAGVSERQLRSDLQRMLSEGVLPSGYIDWASNRLVLTDLNAAAPQDEPVRPEPAKEEPPKEDAKQQEEDADNALLQQIRAVNDAIPDPVMSLKIDRIEEITRKILVYQKKNPAKSDQLRQFLNYYLPTTLKILNAYAQMDAQGVEGKNISATKRRIEGMMDKVVEGFEKQLDQLFQTDAMDITADVEVLEQMLDRDGLGSGMSMF